MDALALVTGLVGDPRCAGCGRPGPRLCRPCRRALRPPEDLPNLRHIDRVLCPWEHEGAARSLVLALKMRGDRSAAPPLAAGMCAVARSAGLRGTVLAWVPGRGADVRRRGFDHAGLLAAHISKALGLPARPVLRRRRNPADQTGLGAAARRVNLEGAFGAHRCPFGIVIVDDVVTTGATAQACARALRAAGATSVEVLAACRAS